ncbi:exonuclease domain-containing protein [Bacillus sp. Marseille-P3661]|uniref:exonuclease domain-containing protein n=1 Tax=Bacillus sp. Marseille-P3661 TaxID=1936234 RepID=UPI000C82EBF3|nr:exonuclease domain-containing protein [Bacillus sp. Marseille-P3661]
MNNMISFIKQLSGRLSPSLYTSIGNQTDAASIAFLRQLQRELKREDVLGVPFSDLKVVVFDIETTGFYPQKGDRILSIGAVKVVGSKIIENETYYSLVYSDSEPSEQIVKLTGITKEHLEIAPSIEVVLKEFYQFISNDTLVAHHASHEKAFMEHVNWSILKSYFQHRIIDTSFLTKIVRPEHDLLSLDDCCTHYGIEIDQRHHALFDAIAAAKLWSKNITFIQEMGFCDLNDVYGYLAKLK